MSSVQSPPSPPHQYPQAIQLKLYQAFIFSIPILFSIILFLLFYLFYLKRRASAISSPILPRTFNGSTNTRPSDSDLKNELKNRMYAVLFDEYMKARDSQCCVCLGEFEMKEELLQVPLCKHIFHIDCIRYWLHNNSTCPLCRAPVAPFQINSNPPPSDLPAPNTTLEINEFESNHHQVAVPPPHQLQSQQCVRSEGSSSGGGTTC